MLQTLSTLSLTCMPCHLNSVVKHFATKVCIVSNYFSGIRLASEDYVSKQRTVKYWLLHEDIQNCNAEVGQTQEHG